MKKSNRIRYDIEKLNNATTSQQYKDELEYKLAEINIDEISTDNAYIQISSQSNKKKYEREKRRLA